MAKVSGEYAYVDHVCKALHYGIDRTPIWFIKLVRNGSIELFTTKGHLSILSQIPNSSLTKSRIKELRFRVKGRKTMYGIGACILLRPNKTIRVYRSKESLIRNFIKIKAV